MSEISLLKLPLEILIKIMGQLSYTDFQNIMLSCKFLRELILNESSIWRLASRNTLIVHNPTNNSLSNSTTFPTQDTCVQKLQKYFWTNVSCEKLLQLMIRNTPEIFQQTIKLSGFQRSRISPNWCKGIYQNKIVLHHQTNFMPWLKMYNSQALLLSLGSELLCFAADKRGFPNCRKILWKLEVPVVQRHDVRTNDISRFIAKNDFILCGNRDGCVAVYKLKSIREKPQLLHHIKDCHDNGRSEVTAVELFNSNNNPYIVTASNSSSNLCFWHLTTESNNFEDTFSNIQCTNEISFGERLGMRCINVNNTEDKLAIGPSGNSKPLVLDVSSGKLLLNFNDSMNVKKAVRDVGWHDDNTVIYVTHSGFLQLLDIRTGKLVYNAMDPFQSTLYCVKSDKQNAIVVGSSEYSRCVLFDSRNSSRHVQMYFTQKQRKSSPIYSLDFDTPKLVAASDRSVAVLNFSIDSSTANPRDYSQPFQIVPR